MDTGELFGKEVLDAGANKVGKVVDLEFDVKQGVVHYIEVKAGLTKRYAVTLDQIDRIGDKVLLNVAEDQLQKKK